MKLVLKKNLSQNIPVILSFFLIIILILIPTGYEGALIYQGAQRCSARVLSTDNSMIISSGLVKTGEQICGLEILDGAFKGQLVDGYNMLSGSMKTDKIFEEGDKAFVLISHKEGQILSVSMIDIYRVNKEIILAGIFILLLLIFAGKTGVRAILSFSVTILMLWKVLVPGYLKGNNPILLGFIITLVLSFIIISLVYGFDRRAVSAISGAVLGIVTTGILGVLFTDIFQINGAVMEYSESLLYSGYANLNLTQIFMSGIFIGSSGAVIDLSVDITSAVNEVIHKKPDITRKEALLSGIRIGRDNV
ncbi:MAG: hypothetical protein K0R92_3623, partial [Lachnospiraceae bacterium]|nr:hypothetical protein [Lachnospiraceae bacterium]